MTADGTVSLREHFEHHLRMAKDEQDRLLSLHADEHRMAREAHMLQHLHDDRALTLATESLSHRLGSMNEFREQLASQAQTFVTKVELAGLAERAETHVTRGELFGWMGVGLTIVTLVVTLLLRVTGG